MPCRDWTATEVVSGEYLSKLTHRATIAEAGLCAILTVMEKNMTEKTMTQYIDSIDWKEAGISKESFLLWWKEHKAEDAKRRKAEAKRASKEKKKEKLRETALSKLTDEEKKILGIKS